MPGVIGNTPYKSPNRNAGGVCCSFQHLDQTFPPAPNILLLADRMVFKASDDIFRLIFDALICACSATDQSDWPFVTYNAERAAAGFHVAAVCRRWRVLAQTHQALWAYFGFPEDPHKYPRHLERLQLLVDRSRNAPIDIVLSINSIRTHHEEEELELSFRLRSFLKLFSSLAPARWRHAQFRLSTFAAYLMHGSFKKDCPLLESLAIDVEWTKHDLPRAPRLERLYLRIDDRFEADLPPMASVQFPNLERLVTAATRFGALGQALCEHNAAHLKELSILDTLGYPWQFESLPLSMPNLTSLTLTNVTHMNYIAAPKVYRLAFWGACLRLPTFTNRDTITTLVLYGRLTNSAIIRLLKDFQHVETLVFDLPREVVPDYRGQEAYLISETFFTELCGIRPPIWPQLRRLHFVEPFNAMPAEVNEEGLLRFVAERNAGVHDEEGQGSLARITEVQISDWVASASTQQELARLIGVT